MMIGSPPLRRRFAACNAFRYHRAVTASTTSQRSNTPLAARVAEFGPLVALTLLVVSLSVYSPFFRKPENYINILNQGSFVGIVALGMTLVIILGGIDLSVGSMVGLLAGLGMHFMQLAAAAPEAGGLGWGPAGAIAIAFLTMLLGGALLGAFNGLLVSIGRLPPFIATLGGLAIYRSVILALARGAEIAPSVAAFEIFGSSNSGVTIPFILSSRGKPLILTVPILAFLGLAILVHLLLKRTVLGAQLTAIGDNSTAARYAGIRLNKVTVLVYMICGLCCGVAALLNASRMNSVSSSQTGLMWELDAIAAVVIGGTSMRGGRGSIFGTVVGVLFLGVIDNMLVILDLNDHLHGLAKGVIIIAAVLLQRSRAQR